MATTKEHLLNMLKLWAENPRDVEVEHSVAETLLLDYVNDPEIEAAWDKASANWWYA